VSTVREATLVAKVGFKNSKSSTFSRYTSLQKVRISSSFLFDFYQMVSRRTIFKLQQLIVPNLDWIALISQAKREEERENLLDNSQPRILPS